MSDYVELLLSARHSDKERFDFKIWVTADDDLSTPPICCLIQPASRDFETVFDLTPSQARSIIDFLEFVLKRRFWQKKPDFGTEA